MKPITPKTKKIISWLEIIVGTPAAIILVISLYMSAPSYLGALLSASSGYVVGDGISRQIDARGKGAHEVIYNYLKSKFSNYKTKLFG